MFKGRGVVPIDSILCRDLGIGWFGQPPGPVYPAPVAYLGS